MADDIQPIDRVSAGGEIPPAFHGRVYVIRPTGALGKFAMAAVLVAAGVLLFTVGLTLLATIAGVALVTGLGFTAYRALGGKPPVAIAPPPLDPSKEIRGGAPPDPRKPI